MVDLAASIQDLGLAGIIVLIVVVATIGLARQWWVPGWMYAKSEKRGETSDMQAVRNAEALDKSSAAYVEMSDALAELSKAYSEIAKSYADLRRTVATSDRIRKRAAPVDGPR